MSGRVCTRSIRTIRVCVCVCILVFPDLLVYYLRAILPYIFPLDYVYTDNSRFFFLRGLIRPDVLSV